MLGVEHVARLVDLLSDDARLSMPPEPMQCRGPADIVAFLRERRFWGPDLVLAPTRANGQPAFVYSRRDGAAEPSGSGGVMVLTVADGRVTGLTRFGGERTIARFDGPAGSTDEIDPHTRTRSDDA